MSTQSVVNRAESYGRVLNVIGAGVAAMGIGLGIYIGGKAHGAQTISPDGAQSAAGAFQVLSYLSAIVIGLSGVVVGAILGWAGYMLRTLAAVHERIARMTPPNLPTRAYPAQVPSPPLPAFDQMRLRG